MALRRTGEFGLIRQIQKSQPQYPPHVLKGIGDDAALISTRPGCTQVVTTDVMVEKIHYDLDYTPLDSLGWKALAINLSDLAAMAAEPRCAVVNLGIPATWTDENVSLLYDGLNRCSEIYGCPIVGGDTVKSPNHSFIGITVIGEVEEGQATMRSGAQVGDPVCVTGDLGGARTGLEVLSSNVDEYVYPKSTLKFLEPKPQIGIARELLSAAGVTSMIDISDGLASEIHHLCEESGVGCRIDSSLIPIASEAVKWAAKKNISSTDFTLSSGEEYELLFTCAPSAWENVCELKTPVTRIGEIVPQESGVKLIESDEERVLENKGWDHFA